MSDFNSRGVDPEWINAIIAKIRTASPKYIFQILSKIPAKFADFDYPSSVWLGTSIENNSVTWRVKDLIALQGDNLKFVSVEPLHEEIDYYFKDPIKWVIVGAETRNKNRIIPERAWVQRIVDNCRVEHIPLLIKRNVGITGIPIDDLRRFP